MVCGIEYPSTAIFTFVLLLGIWKSRWRATIQREVFLTLTIGFFLYLMAEETNEMFFGSIGNTLNESFWLRALFLLPWGLMIWVHTKNTILNKNILYGKKAEK